MYKTISTRGDIYRMDYVIKAMLLKWCDQRSHTLQYKQSPLQSDIYIHTYIFIYIYIYIGSSHFAFSSSRNTHMKWPLLSSALFCHAQLCTYFQLYQIWHHVVHQIHPFHFHVSKWRFTSRSNTWIRWILRLLCSVIPSGYLNSPSYGGPVVHFQFQFRFCIFQFAIFNFRP